MSEFLSNVKGRGKPVLQCRLKLFDGQRGSYWYVLWRVRHAHRCSLAIQETLRFRLIIFECKADIASRQLSTLWCFWAWQPDFTNSWGRRPPPSIFPSRIRMIIKGNQFARICSQVINTMFQSNLNTIPSRRELRELDGEEQKDGWINLHRWSLRVPGLWQPRAHLAAFPKIASPVLARNCYACAFVYAFTHCTNASASYLLMFYKRTTVARITRSSWRRESWPLPSVSSFFSCLRTSE